MTACHPETLVNEFELAAGAIRRDIIQMIAVAGSGHPVASPSGPDQP